MEVTSISGLPPGLDCAQSGSANGDVSDVIDNAFDQEEGAYYVIGLKAGPLSLDLGHKLDSTYGYGWLSLQQHVDSYSDARSDAGGSVLTASLGAELTHFGVRTDLAWIAPQEWGWPGLRWGIATVLKGGEAPDDGPAGWDEYQREATIGPAVYWNPQWEGIPWASFTANIRYGYRREGFLRNENTEGENTNGERSTEQHVIASDVALLLNLTGSQYGGFGLKLGVTAWIPLDGSETLAVPGRTLTVMEEQIVGFFTFDYGFQF